MFRCILDWFLFVHLHSLWHVFVFNQCELVQPEFFSATFTIQFMQAHDISPHNIIKPMDFNRFRIYTYSIIISWSLLTFFKIQFWVQSSTAFNSSIFTQFQFINSITRWIQINCLHKYNLLGNWNDSIFKHFFQICSFFFFTIATMITIRSGCCRGTFWLLFWKLFGKWKWIVNLNWIPTVFVHLFLYVYEFNPNKNTSV